MGGGGGHTRVANTTETFSTSVVRITVIVFRELLFMTFLIVIVTCPEVITTEFRSGSLD